MSKKRGLSLEEKRKRMMEIFFEKKDVFQLKELEKIGPKEKGITSMSIKEVVHGLVDDNLVDSDRIGISVYFWSFPSKASQAQKRKLQTLNEALEQTEKKRKATEAAVSKATQGREVSGFREAAFRKKFPYVGGSPVAVKERTKLLNDIEEKEKELKELNAELQKYREVDPEVLNKIKQETEVAKEAVNRWTDNIFSVKSWCKKKFGMEEKLLDQQFGIPEDFDYID